MSSVILPPNNGSSGLHVSQDGFSLHLTYLAWISSAISCDLATMSSVTPEVESLACSVNKATLAEAAAASALAASTKDVKHSCESDCPLQLVWTFCAASCASDWAASNAACSASHPKEDLGGLAMMSSTSPKEMSPWMLRRISSKQPDTSTAHSCAFALAASALSFASSTELVTHSLTASTSPTQCSKYALFAVASSCICFSIKFAFACNILAFAVIFAFIFSPHSLTSPTQFCNSLPAASASDLNLAISASKSAEVLAIKSLSSALSSPSSNFAPGAGNAEMHAAGSDSVKQLKHSDAEAAHFCKSEDVFVKSSSACAFAFSKQSLTSDAHT